MVSELGTEENLIPGISRMTKVTEEWILVSPLGHLLAVYMEIRMEGVG